jgi:hypothetical protein
MAPRRRRDEDDDDEEGTCATDTTGVVSGVMLRLAGESSADCNAEELQSLPDDDEEEE